MYEASATLPGRAVNAMANDKRATIAGLVGDLHQALTNYDELLAKLTEKTSCLRIGRPEAGEGPAPGIPSGSPIGHEIAGSVTRLQAYNRRLESLISEFDV
jgi:hypothetical protein